MPAISFCIPFYRGKDYLAQAIDSVLRQSIADWELVVVDDCGPEEGVAELVTSYGDSRINYQRNEKNLGLAGNWNKCLELARADVVTLLHGDDKLEPTYAELILKAFQDYPQAAAVFCRAWVMDEVGRRTFSFPDFVKTFYMPATDQVMDLKGESAVAAILRGNFIFCPSLCFQKSQLKGVRFSEQWKMVLDLDLILTVLLAGGTLIGLPQKAYAYRRHADNQTMHLTESMRRFEEEAEIYSQYGEKTRAMGWGRASRIAHGMRIVKLHLAFLLLKSLLFGRWGMVGNILGFVLRNRGRFLSGALPS